MKSDLFRSFIGKATLIIFLLITGSMAKDGHAQYGTFLEGDSIIVGCGDSATLTAYYPKKSGTLFEDFNDLALDSGFVTNSNPDYGNLCKASIDSTPYAWFDPNSTQPRSIRTVDLTADSSTKVCFEFRMAVEDGSGPPCEGPDIADEGVYFQYSADSGNTWSIIQYFNPDTNDVSGGPNSPFASWKLYCFNIPDSLADSTIRFRWYQNAGSGADYDHWGLENLAIKNNSSDTSTVFDWGNGLTSKSDTSFLPTDSSTYSVTIIDTVAGDTVSANAFVDFTPLQAGVYPSALNMCGKDSSQLQVTGVNGAYKYDWSPGTALSDSTAAVIKTGTDTPLNYSVVVEDSVHSFCKDTAFVQVDTGSSPTPSVQTDSVICGGETDTLFLANSYDSTVWNGSITTDTFLVDASYGSPTQSHKVTVFDSNGCSGSDTVQLSVDSTNALVQVQNDTLLANNSNGSYQWVNCDSAYTPISGANSQSFYPSSNGKYAVVITNSNGCKDTSQCKSSLPNSIWNNIGSGVPGGLFSVHFADSSNGWVATSNGSILHTSDGGNSWSVQMDTTLALRAIHFADTTTGWTVGDSGTILFTDNGGNTWNTQNGGVTEDLHSVYSANTNKVWAVGDSGTTIHSSNGGAVWNFQTSGTTQDLFSVHFPDVDTGWSVGTNGSVLRTVDGGSNWMAQNSATGEDLNSVYFINDTLGWTVGDNGTILRTQNAGASWIDQLSGTTEDLESVYFVNDSVGYIVGANGTILYTTDGRTSWIAQTNGDLHRLKDVHFANRRHGWCVGMNGTLLRLGNSNSNPNSIEKEDPKASIRAYPNPVRKKLRIERAGSEGDLKLTLYDNIGQRLKEKRLSEGSKTTILSMEEFEGGVYFLKVEKKGSEGALIREVKKIVVGE